MSHGSKLRAAPSPVTASKDTVWKIMNWCFLRRIHSQLYSFIIKYLICNYKNIEASDILLQG